MSHRTRAFAFDEVTIPAAVSATWTVARDAPRRPLVDLTLEIQWPQLYTTEPETRGTLTNDWAIQLLSSWYFVR